MFSNLFRLFSLLAMVMVAGSVIHVQPATAQPLEANSLQAPDVRLIDADALARAADDAATRIFYDRGGWRAVWTEAASRDLDRSLAQRARHGLDRLVFLDTDAATGAAAIETAHTKAALNYASALARGASDAASRRDADGLLRPKLDLSGQLAEALTQGRVGEWLESLAPQDNEYARLSQAYLLIRQEMGAGNLSPIAQGVIRPGESDSRVPTIVNRLTGSQYLVPQTLASESPYDMNLTSASERYTQLIADAIKQLQRDYGIAEDGVIGPVTLEVLNLRPADRVRALAVALERLRWLTRNPPALRIDVNTAAAQLFYYRDNVVVDTRRVVVGKPGTETPQIISPIYRLVANPTWTIPKSIQHGEMAGVSRAYLRRKNMVRRAGWIVQRSGPGNALGLVKFDMLNNMSIYLHDTSAPQLFERSQRHLSHGCVRVDDALGFAQRLAQDEGVANEWEKARAGGEQQFVDLPRHIPVRLIYQNVFIDSEGAVAYRMDPYGWNTPVARALGFDNAFQPRVRAEATEVSP